MSNNCIITPSSQIVLADPYWNNVVLCINMAGGTLADAKGHVLTPAGAIAVNNSNPLPFSPYSLNLLAQGYVSTPDSADWDMASSDFTIEAWVRQVTRTGGYTGNIQGIIEQAAFGAYADGCFDFTLNNGAVAGNMHGGGANNSVASPSQIALSTWVHMCFERFGNQYTIYEGGQAKNQQTYAQATAVNSTKVLMLGADSSGQGMFNGQLGPMRITKGVARYKGNFAVPTALFPTQ